LFLEGLETRLLPSVALVVNSLADNTAVDGKVTLREAIEAANTNGTVGDAVHDGSGGIDTIRFDPTVFATPQTITLTLGELPITDGLTITGPAADLTISGNNASRIFNIDNGNSATAIHVQLAGLTLTGGRVILVSQSGGAIANAENLTMTGCTLTENQAFGDNGGGLFNSGTATLTNCTLADNRVTGADGGALYNTGTATLGNCTVTGNAAEFSQFSGADAGNGGAILSSASLSLRHCTVSGNFADEGGAGLFVGGNVTLRNCTLSNNTANEGDGGGIFAIATQTLTDCTFLGNSAAGGGGFFNYLGTATVAGCSFAGNSAGDGGAIESDFGHLALASCTLSGNTAGPASTA
jgi:CSLREA domain-containing protein